MVQTRVISDVMTMPGAALRNGNAFAVFGDSRMADIFRDGAKRVKDARNWFNIANARLGQRLVLAGHYAVSGQRSDQFLADANVTAALATSARYFIMGGVVNDIAQNGNTYDYFSGPGVGGFAGIKAVCDRIISAGGVPILLTEPGAANLTTSAQFAAINIYNQKVRQYVREKSGAAILFDLARVLVNPTAAPIGMKSGLTFDGLHASIAGGQAAGAAFASLISPVVPVLEQGPYGLVDVVANGGVQLLANPLFSTTSGGTAGSGVTGNVPASWEVTCTAGFAVAVSTAAGDVGNDLVLSITASGAGMVRVNQPIASGDSVGDVFEGLGEFDVDAGHSQLAGVWTRLESGRGAGFYSCQDLFVDTSYGAMASGAAQGLVARTLPVTIEAGTRNYFNFRMQIEFLAAGSATIRMREMAVRKILTL